MSVQDGRITRRLRSYVRTVLLRCPSDWLALRHVYRPIRTWFLVTVPSLPRSGGPCFPASTVIGTLTRCEPLPNAGIVSVCREEGQRIDTTDLAGPVILVVLTMKALFGRFMVEEMPTPTMDCASAYQSG